MVKRFQTSTRVPEAAPEWEIYQYKLSPWPPVALQIIKRDINVISKTNKRAYTYYLFIIRFG